MFIFVNYSGQKISRSLSLTGRRTITNQMELIENGVAFARQTNIFPKVLTGGRSHKKG